ncbi:MAG TPA: phosphoribosylformylglycinamidine synthase [Clostridia bacterium]
MKEKIYRVFIEKKQGFDVASQELKKELNQQLKLNLQDVKIFLRYDIACIQKSDFKKAVETVLSEAATDNVYYEKLPKLKDYKIFAAEFLPGQYDQRADNAAQCIQLLTQKQRPEIRCAAIYAFKGAEDNEINKIQNYLINPVESRLCDLRKPKTLQDLSSDIKPIQTINGFINMDKEALKEFHAKFGFAMTVEDLEVVRDHFKAENRDPNEAELKVIDTYWSDHCRHTTFLTQITDIKINSSNPHLQKALEKYQELFNKLYAGRKDKYQCLMDIATIAVKELKAQGKLDNLEESDEINACSIKVKAQVDGKEEEWIVMFKNETHNHPTEIEPFGGAATCLGGAIRDPLSGRVYVYQAMRITGAADPTVSIENTLQGKLPQRVLTKTAAAGYSSYGNQIGLNAGLVKEIYHPNYVAKRMEAGFVAGAAPSSCIVRQKPEPGDIVVLLGGKTGRDGIGGATGSSKAHTANVADTAGAEVQKGNALLERYIQRLFRNPEVTKIIKKCNDFGAGGVSVAIGELAPGLAIYLDRVPLKYPGLNPLEIAISESQERMALVIAKDDFETLKRFADMENLDVTAVAEVNDTNRMTMYYNGQKVIDIDRGLLNTNGARQYAAAEIEDNSKDIFYDRKDIDEYLKNNDYKTAVLRKLSDLNICSQKGLIEMFDASIGAGNTIMPLGGRKQLTCADYMVCKLPVKEDQKTTTATVASWGYNPDMMSTSPFMGAVYSIVLSVMRAVSGGADPDTIKLTLQEYFLRLGKDPKRWGVPTAAMLGALYAQLGLKMGAIGGKDSMSGTFENIDVPPTLISFALGLTDSRYKVVNVLKQPGQEIVWVKLKRDEFGMPDFDYINKLIRVLYENIKSGNIEYAQVVENGGAAIAAIKSALSNDLGVRFYNAKPEMFDKFAGDCLISAQDLSFLDGFEYEKLGTTVQGDTIINNEAIALDEIIQSFTSTLNSVFPDEAKDAGEVQTINSVIKDYPKHCKYTFARPKVFIPVILGSNGEYDLERAFRESGAEVEPYVLKYRSPEEIAQSITDMAKVIKDCQILAFPGGISSVEETGGAGRFIAAVFGAPALADAVNDLLERGGLIIGVGSGFQALLKLGLLPYGRMTKNKNNMTLTVNNINRHVSTIAKIRICSTNSPWLAGVKTGEIFGSPISSAEGKFVADIKDIGTLKQNGQIFSQYVDDFGDASSQYPYNPTGSMQAVEGLISPDGKVLGKLGHIERCRHGYKNIDLPMDLKIFESGVQYFK